MEAGKRGGGGGRGGRNEGEGSWGGGGGQEVQQDAQTTCLSEGEERKGKAVLHGRFHLGEVYVYVIHWPKPGRLFREIYIYSSRCLCSFFLYDHCDA